MPQPVQAKVKTLLLPVPAISAIIGVRLYNLRAGVKVPTPYATMEVFTNPTVHLRGRADQDKHRIRFHLFGQNYMELDALGRAIEAAMTATTLFSATPEFETEMYEDETDLYHLVRDYSVFNDRST